MGRVIAIANQKGGVGKTTTCINLACALNNRNKSVLVVDCDPQGNCSSGMGVDKNTRPNIYDLIINGSDAQSTIIKTKYCDIIPANRELSGATVELVDIDSREFVLRNVLAPLKSSYDYILIDCPPSLEMLTLNALVAADELLVPVQCEYFAMEGLSDLLTTVRMANLRLNPSLEVEGMILTMYDSRTNLSEQVAGELRKHFGSTVYETMIPRNVRLSESPSHGKPVIVYDRMSRGSRSYLKLASEFLRRHIIQG